MHPQLRTLTVIVLGVRLHDYGVFAFYRADEEEALRGILVPSCPLCPPHNHHVGPSPPPCMVVVLGRLGYLDRRTLLAVHLVVIHQRICRWQIIGALEQTSRRRVT